jgi:hypothetical protein
MTQCVISAANKNQKIRFLDPRLWHYSRNIVDHNLNAQLSKGIFMVTVFSLKTVPFVVVTITFYS